MEIIIINWKISRRIWHQSKLKRISHVCILNRRVPEMCDNVGCSTQCVSVMVWGAQHYPYAREECELVPHFIFKCGGVCLTSGSCWLVKRFLDLLLQWLLPLWQEGRCTAPLQVLHPFHDRPWGSTRCEHATLKGESKDEGVWNTHKCVTVSFIIELYLSHGQDQIQRKKTISYLCTLLSSRSPFHTSP